MDECFALCTLDGSEKQKTHCTHQNSAHCILSTLHQVVTKRSHQANKDLKIRRLCICWIYYHMPILNTRDTTDIGLQEWDYLAGVGERKIKIAKLQAYRTQKKTNLSVSPLRSSANPMSLLVEWWFTSTVGAISQAISVTKERAWYWRKTAVPLMVLSVWHIPWHTLWNDRVTRDKMWLTFSV